MNPGWDDPPTQATSGVADTTRVPRVDERLFVGPLERPDEYELIDSGRKGGEGIVYRGLFFGTLPQPIIFAVKQLLAPPGLNPNEWPDERQVAQWNENLKLLRLVHHDHLVGYRELFWGWPPHPAGSYRESPPPELRTWYFVMEWVEGQSLQALVDSSGGATSVAARLALITQLAEAVDELHSGGQTAQIPLLHRDIKPGNVIVHPTRGAVLVDYGLVHVEGPNSTSVAAYTPPYTAPEVHADGTLTSRASDLWSVAATAFFALTGERPSPSDVPGMRRRLQEHLNGVVPDLVGMTEEMMTVLERSPAERPTGAQAWARRLQATLNSGVTAPTDDGVKDFPVEGDLGVSEERVSADGAPVGGQRRGRDEVALQPSESPVRRRRRFALVGIIGVLALAGAGVGIAVVGSSGSGRAPANGSVSRGAGLAAQSLGQNASTTTAPRAEAPTPTGRTTSDVTPTLTATTTSSVMLQPKKSRLPSNSTSRGNAPETKAKAPTKSVTSPTTSVATSTTTGTSTGAGGATTPGTTVGSTSSTTSSVAGGGGTSTSTSSTTTTSMSTGDTGTGAAPPTTGSTTTFVSIWAAVSSEPAGCSGAFTPGYSLSGPIDQSQIGCGWNTSGTVLYVWLHSGSSASYRFTIPSGTSGTVSYGIPAGGALNNAAATVSVDGGSPETLDSNLGGHGSVTSSNLVLWTSDSLSVGTHTVTVTSLGDAVNVYGFWITS